MTAFVKQTRWEVRHESHTSGCLVSLPSDVRSSMGRLRQPHVLIALVGGLSMASLAGARRTDSSFPIYVTSTNPATTQVSTAFDDPASGIPTGYNPRSSVQSSTSRWWSRVRCPWDSMATSI